MQVSKNLYGSAYFKIEGRRKKHVLYNGNWHEIIWSDILGPINDN